MAQQQCFKRGGTPRTLLCQQGSALPRAPSVMCCVSMTYLAGKPDSPPPEPRPPETKGARQRATTGCGYQKPRPPCRFIHLGYAEYTPAPTPVY
jgi:hypothetical protein